MDKRYLYLIFIFISAFSIYMLFSNNNPEFNKNNKIDNFRVEKVCN